MPGVDDDMRMKMTMIMNECHEGEKRRRMLERMKQVNKLMVKKVDGQHERNRDTRKTR